MKSADTQNPSSPNDPVGTADPAAPSNPLRALSAALQAESDDNGDGAPPSGQQPTDKKPTTLAEAAKRLGLTDAEFYALSVPMAGGAEPVTVGKLKDLLGEHDAFTVRTLQTDQAHRAREAKLIQAESELEALLAGLPPNALKPEALQAAQTRRASQRAAEQAKLAERIPAWSDSAVRDAELKGIEKHLESYGLDGAFLLRNFSADVMNYVRTNYERERRLTEALARVKPNDAGTKPIARSRAAPLNGASRAAPTQSREQREVASFIQTIQQAGRRQ